MIHENRVCKIVKFFKQEMPTRKYLKMCSNQIDRVKANRTSKDYNVRLYQNIWHNH